MAPLKVIGAGYGRTGTRSLCEALDLLGYSCHHMEKVILDPEQSPKVFSDAYATGNHPDWDQVFKSYDAAVDWPAAAFWKELSQRYPDAKVILTVRDAEKWYDSVAKTIMDLQMEFSEEPSSSPSSSSASSSTTDSNNNNNKLRCKLMQLAELRQVILHNGELKDFPDRPAMVRHFHQHIATVKETIPPERLLVFESQHGWEPLCRFLGVDVPQGVPYPHVNTREAFGEMFESLKRRLESQ